MAMTDTQSVVSANVERLLDGRTQVWLARKLGVASMYVHRRMRGHAQWSADDIKRVSEVLVTTPGELLADIDVEPVREAGHAYPVLLHLCLAFAVVTLLAAALPGQALAFVAGGALAVVLSGTATLAVQVVRTLRALDDHP